MLQSLDKDLPQHSTAQHCAAQHSTHLSFVLVGWFPRRCVPAGVVEVLPSLLDFRPETYGLPPFQDRVSGALVLDPVWRMKGTVVKGFGRGSKVRFCHSSPLPQYLISLALTPRILYSPKAVRPTCFFCTLNLSVRCCGSSHVSLQN